VFTAIQGVLRERLYRAFCPPTGDLVSYQHGLLPTARATALAAHLAECPHCAQEMRLIARAANDPPVMAMLAGGPRLIVAELQSQRQEASLVPLYGATRSFGGGAQYAYRAENLELTLHVARAAGQTDRLVMTGTLASEDETVAALLSAATASLLHNADVLAIVPLDELGGFLFDDLLPGEYSLSLRFDECEVLVESLAL
jgi:hypothetical protein